MNKIKKVFSTDTQSVKINYTSPVDKQKIQKTIKKEDGISSKTLSKKQEESPYTATTIFWIAIGVEYALIIIQNYESISQDLLTLNIGHLFGTIAGCSILPLVLIIISLIIATPLFFIFKNVAQKYKKWFEYFSTTLLIVTLSYIFLQIYTYFTLTI